MVDSLALGPLSFEPFDPRVLGSLLWEALPMGGRGALVPAGPAIQALSQGLKCGSFRSRSMH